MLPGYFTFLRDGIPVASQVLSAALAANGLPPDASASPLEVRAAVFLPEGKYVVMTPRAAQDPKTGKDVFRQALVGTFTVPSLEHVELIDHDNAPQKP